MTEYPPLSGSGQVPMAGRRAVAAFAAAAGAVVLTEFIAVGLLPALARDFDISLSRAGWLVSAFALSAALLGPALTLGMGRIRPRTGLALGLVLYGGAGGIAALIQDFHVFLAVRIVQGALLTYFISAASKTAMDLSPPERAARAVGHVNVGTILGAMAATPLGLWGADALGWQAIYLALGGAAVLSAFPVLATVPRILGPVRAAISGEVSILRTGPVLAHLALSLMTFAAMFSAYSFIAPVLSKGLGASAGPVSVVLIGIGAAGLIGNALASKEADRDPDRATLGTLAVLALSGSALVLLGWNPVADFLMLTAWGAAHAAAFVACQVRVMVQAPQAAAFAGSLNIAVCNVGIGIGAVLGGWVLEAAGTAWLGPAMAAVALPAILLNGWLMRAQGRRIADRAGAP
ncbi:MAG: MFS transporter [Alphaproteobacteria bacterium]|nr:MFS transporter [Alphaproteobacteria bacterium]